MRQKLWVTYLNLALFCVLLVGIEAGGQILFFIVKGQTLFQSAPATDERLAGHSLLLEPHPYLVARLKGKVRVENKGRVVSTTADHTRWTGANPEDQDLIRIAVVGGSTTFGAGVTDSATWPARLQAHLGPRYAVINYGLPGFSTAEGIVQMGLVIPERRPHIVVFYEGWNDIRSYHEPGSGPDYYSHGMRQFTNLGIWHPREEPVLTKLAAVSAIGRLALVLSKREPPPDTAMASTRELFDTPDPFVDRIYIRNLTTLRLLAREAGAYAMLIPQVINERWYQAHSGGDPWTPHIRNSAMPDLIRRFNGFMDQACAPGEAGCRVIHQLAAVEWEADDFIDGAHFSGKGDDKFAQVVSLQIREQVARLPSAASARP